MREAEARRELEARRFVALQARVIADAALAAEDYAASLALLDGATLRLTRIENTKRRRNTPWLFLDAGYNLLLDSAAVRWYYHMVNASRMNEGSDADFRVVGPLCDSADCFFDVEGEYLWEALERS